MRIRYIPLLALGMLATLCALSDAEETPDFVFEIGEPRGWTGVNRKIFYGSYFRLEGDLVSLYNDRGETIKVGLANLIESDRKLITDYEAYMKREKGGEAEPQVDQAAYKQLPQADRSLIPGKLPKDFGGETKDQAVDALWVSLLWWDANQIFPIPKKGDFEEKAEWLLDEMSRHVPTGGRSAVTMEEAKEGVMKYFEKRLSEIGKCQATVIDAGLDPGVLAKLTAGNDIVILKTTMVYSNGGEYSCTMVLGEMKEDGSFVVHLFGRPFTGKMVPAPDRKSETHNGNTYELVLTNKQDLPPHVAEVEPRLYVNDSGFTGALQIKPYVFK